MFRGFNLISWSVCVCITTTCLVIITSCLGSLCLYSSPFLTCFSYREPNSKQGANSSFPKLMSIPIERLL